MPRRDFYPFEIKVRIAGEMDYPRETRLEMLPEAWVEESALKALDAVLEHGKAQLAEESFGLASAYIGQMHRVEEEPKVFEVLATTVGESGLTAATIFTFETYAPLYAHRSYDLKREIGKVVTAYLKTAEGQAAASARQRRFTWQDLGEIPAEIWERHLLRFIGQRIFGDGALTDLDGTLVPQAVRDEWAAQGELGQP